MIFERYFQTMRNDALKSNLRKAQKFLCLSYECLTGEAIFSKIQRYKKNGICPKIYHKKSPQQKSINFGKEMSFSCWFKQTSMSTIEINEG